MSKLDFNYEIKFLIIIHMYIHHKCQVFSVEVFHVYLFSQFMNLELHNQNA